MGGEWFRTGWNVLETGPQTVHVRPVGDLVWHTLTDDCVCGPTLEVIVYDDAPDGHMYTHHALDGRD